MNFSGIDIGYSNLKTESLIEGELSSSLLPVGVMLDDTNNGLSVNDKDALRVMVDGQHYIAGMSPSDISIDYQRVLHSDYPASDSYKALFHAALLLTSVTKIDVLVTGLPVSQFLDADYRAKLKSQFEGEHQVTKKRKIKVENAVIVPQPLGGYMAAVDANQELSDLRVLVIDPGFYSVDWTMVRNGMVVPNALGTSVKAVSALFEEASGIIFRDHGGKVSIEDIEKAVSSGKGSVILFGDKIELSGILKEAINNIKGDLSGEIKASLRASKSEVDAVLLVGGGAALYENIAKEMFPRSKLVVADNPVSANAHGFRLIASSANGKK